MRESHPTRVRRGRAARCKRPPRCWTRLRGGRDGPVGVRCGAARLAAPYATFSPIALSEWRTQPTCHDTSYPTPVDDQQLIAQVLAADPKAERAFYDQHVDKVYRLAYRLAGDGTLAQDFTQETFVRAFARLSQYRGDAALSTWICAICVTVSLNGKRATSTRHAREAGYDEALTFAVTARESEPDLKVRMQTAIDALPEGYRAVFLMHDLEGFTHEEIGRALEIQPGTSKARLFHARRKLRVALAEFEGEWA
jgi:RNA polymerase sigma-70 factor, ECF subfamily